MKQEEIEQVEDLLYASEGLLGYAYLDPSDGGERKEFVFEMTPGNIAAFIGAHQLDAQKIILTDQLILNTIGGYIDRCPNQELCRQILSILVPIQMGEAGIPDIPIASREAYDAYGRWEDEKPTETEPGMF